MALHLHVLCKKSGPGMLQRDNLTWTKGDSSVLHSGVWLLSLADRQVQPDFIWLHDSMSAPADLGGPVSGFRTSEAQDVTDGKAYANLPKRSTVTFTRQAVPGRLAWPKGKSPVANSYVLDQR